MWGVGVMGGKEGRGRESGKERGKCHVGEGLGCVEEVRGKGGAKEFE